MRAEIDDILDLRAPDPHEFNRIVAWSFAIHLVAITVLFVLPRSWITTDRTPPLLMTISLAGSPGERTTGMTPVGGRPVEQATPAPKRPEPVKPAAAKRDVMKVPEKTPVKPPPPKPASAVEQPPSSITRPPTTGREVTTGSSTAETGARGQGTGLTSGGGGTGAAVDMTFKFCCSDYIVDMQRRIERYWQRGLPDRGETVLQFVIHRDGHVTDITVEKSSGSGLLDRAARSALMQATLAPLPDRYEADTLTVHLHFPYGVR